MNIYLVAIDYQWHQCPAEPDQHPWSIDRQILAVTPGRRCVAPVTIHIGDTAAVVACGRHEPAERQCTNCRNVITYQHTLPGVA